MTIHEKERQEHNLPQENPMNLVAYHIEQGGLMNLAPAPRHRVWMQETDKGFANRCLPLLIANQAGWFLESRHTFRVLWNGNPETSALQIMYFDGVPPYPATSIFGYGILTFTIPYVFRTPPGYNLLVRGPANMPKDGISPLEGIIETDWAVATFTMNWKVTRPNHLITFNVGEPICMIVPQKRGELEEFSPSSKNIEWEPELNLAFRKWAISRKQFQIRLKMTQARRKRQHLWQKHYFQGTFPGGQVVSEHQTKLRLKLFKASADESEKQL